MTRALNRREFTARSLWGAVLVGAGSTAAAQAPANRDPQALADAVAGAQLGLIEQLYPEHLTDELRATLRQKLARQALRSRLLSAYRLTNADEPATMFAAYRAAE